MRFDAATRQITPPFNDEYEQFRESVRTFVVRELNPHVAEWERAKLFPTELFQRCGELGYLGLKYPERYGGQAADDSGDYVADAVFLEELGRCESGGVAAGLGAHTSIATPPIWKFGTEEQKQRYLTPAITGEKIGALGITEPNAGSDVAGIKTNAQPTDGGYVVSGSKLYITNGVRADFIVTAVKTTKEGGHHGISFLIVDRGKGVESSALEKLGWHSSDTALITFDDVFVPRENLLSEENKGFYLIMANFQWERLMMALVALGTMQHWFEKTLRFALERQAFGRPVGKFQAIRHKFAELATTIEAGRAITYNALRLFVAGANPIREVTMAKLATQQASVDLLDSCLQIHGGAGYMREYGIECALRDARIGPIGGGTDEIMKELLGRTYGL